MTTKSDTTQELDRLYKKVRHNSRIIYYTDTIGKADDDGRRDWAMRDDMWAITTSELDKFKALITKREKELLERLKKDLSAVEYEVHSDMYGEERLKIVYANGARDKHELLNKAIEAERKRLENE